MAGSGAVSSNAGFEAVVSCFGSMGRSVDDLEASARILIDGSTKLSRTLGLLPLPYRDEVELPKKLKVGYYLTGEHLFQGLRRLELSLTPIYDVQMGSVVPVRRAGGRCSRRWRRCASAGTSASSSRLLLVSSLSNHAISQADL